MALGVKLLEPLAHHNRCKLVKMLFLELKGDKADIKPQCFVKLARVTAIIKGWPSCTCYIIIVKHLVLRDLNLKLKQKSDFILYNVE